MTLGSNQVLKVADFKLIEMEGKTILLFNYLNYK